MEVFLRGQRINLDPSSSIGKGGEADVFAHGTATALKVFKAPEHPDYAGSPSEQRGARERIALHQNKLREFPRGLPARVVAPRELLTDDGGKRIVGYAMEQVRGAEVLLRCSEPSLRNTGFQVNDVAGALADLHRTVESLHAAGVTIGDFNDLNVLVRGREAFLIDADSFQFGPFLCKVYTERFVDPLLCDDSLQHPVLARPYSPASDWYAFAVMTMQSLLCVGPYGGVFKPKDPSRRVPQAARPLRRITVFDPEVVYPKPAIPYRALPDDLLHELHLVFEKDRRGPFPRGLVEDLEWRRCPTCHLEHARAACTTCQIAAPLAVKEVTTVRGDVLATRVLETRGVVVAAALQGGKLAWLVHEDGQFRREDGRVVLSGARDPFVSFALQGAATIVGRGTEAVSIVPGKAPERIGVDAYRGRPMLAATSGALHWVRGGRLLRRRVGGGAPGGIAALVEDHEERIGDVLAGQTVFWAGERLGFGFYRAGAVSVAFVFDATRVGLKDTVKLPFLPGEIVDVDCALGERRAFFFMAAEVKGTTVHQCVVVGEDGSVEAAARGEAGDGSWLGALHGRCVVGGSLLAPTDAGVVRVEVRDGALVETRHFPDTEPFVNQASRLLAGPRGLYVVDPARIRVLQIS